MFYILNFWILSSTNQPTDFTSETSSYINKYKHLTFQSIKSVHLNINEL